MKGVRFRFGAKFKRLTGGLFATGDIAAFPSHGDGKLIQVEHWRVAKQQGRLAALNMLGSSQAFTAMRYFWTAQCMVKLEYAGHARGDDA